VVQPLTHALRRVSLFAAALATASVTLAVAPQSAQADEIDTWSSFWQPCGTFMCLYYSPGLTNASWRPVGNNIYFSDLNDVKFSNGGTGTQGAGQVVGNNAASMGNHTSNCNLTVWVGVGMTGTYSQENWLKPGHAGNLTPTLRNHDRSINVNNCT